MKKVILVLLCTLLLQGCGFGIGSKHPRLKQKYPIMDVAFSRDTHMHQLLIQSLSKEGVEVVSHENAPILKIISKTLEQRPILYALDGELRREQMRLTMQFELIDHDMITPITLSTSRERAIISRQRLAADIELQQIEYGMQRDIMHQLIWQLSLA